MSNEKHRPLVAISLGDPAGVGPEIVVKALASGELYGSCRPLVVGDLRVLRRAVEICGLPTEVVAVDEPGHGSYTPEAIDVIDLQNVDQASLEIGQVQAMCGQAANDYIERCVELALAHEVDALATAPINKPALRAAGIRHAGHTEILGALAGVEDPLTMFEVRGLRIFFLSRHVSLRRACDMVTTARVLDYLVRCSEALTTLGVAEGPLAVAGLNPHCGDDGLFGSEEGDQIAPAVEEALARGYDVAGPVPADSVFHLAQSGRYRGVISLYHDQGHIAAKTLDFERTVAVTLGLPFLRTSVDHGTAFDIAGTGTASAVSLVEAVLLASAYAPRFARAGKAES
jgi:4-hydroxythreonine-4-phosphate dehydrogenase